METNFLDLEATGQQKKEVMMIVFEEEWKKYPSPPPIFVCPCPPENAGCQRART
jgi:hypothetical protein